MIIILILICNSIYKYREISVSPAEINVRKIELCNTLGFYKTALYLLKEYSHYNLYTEDQINRMQAAEKNAVDRLQGLEKNSFN